MGLHDKISASRRSFFLTSAGLLAAVGATSAANAATNLAAANIKATGGTTSRTYGDRWADIINVKDYGAKGDGITNDTNAIQSAFNAVFGMWASPNLSVTGQKSIFFPAGTYIVSPPGGVLTINSCVNNGGNIEFGFSTTHGLSVGDNFYVRGVVSTGSLFANGPQWVLAVNDATHVTVLTAFGGTYTSGGTACVPCLRIKGMVGNSIFGSGRDTTQISTSAPDCAVLHVNGGRYGHFKDMGLIPGTGGLGLDLNWDGIVNNSTQGNFIEHFEVQNSSADVGIAIGWNGAMSSETCLVSCQLSANTGVHVGNYNSTNNTMFGGQTQSCLYGIYCENGDMNTIHGVSFENTANSAGADIYILNSAGSGYSIASCRSESINFIQGGAGNINIMSCAQMGGTGYFLNGGQIATLSNCYSPSGYIRGNVAVILHNNSFHLADFLTHDSPNYAYLEQHPIPVTTQTASTYSFIMSDIGTKVRFNSSSSQTVTIPAWQYIGTAFAVVGGGTISVTGATIQVQQMGTGQTILQGSSGVTIRSSNGLKLRAQYSVATLTVDSNDGAGNIVWTLSGDTTT